MYALVRTLLAAGLLSFGSISAQNFSPPPANLPSDETRTLIADKMTTLEAALRNLPANDPALADVAIYQRAAWTILRHNEFFHKDSAAWTLNVLDRGLTRASLLSQGKSPWRNAAGQTAARGYYSRIDGTPQPFAVTFPADYGKEPNRRWRVDVVLHGRDASLTEVKFLNSHRGDKAAPAEQDYIKLDIFGRGNNAYRWAGETDVFEAIDAFFEGERRAGRERLPDASRIVLRGFSMGGAGAWHLGLHWPDRWCVIGPGAGFTTTHGYTKFADPLPSHQEACLKIYDAVDYAPNAFNVPVVAYSGSKDPQKAAADNIERAVKKLGIPMTHLVAPGLEHKFPPEWFQKANEHYRKFAEKGRPEYPELVNFVTYTLKYPTCEWVTLLGLDKHYEKASMLAGRHETGFAVKTENVNAFQLALPIGVRGPQHVDIDEQKLLVRPIEDVASIYFQRKGKAWQSVLPELLLTQRQKRPQKIHRLQGPIDDAFADAFLCVKGTGKPWHEAVQKSADARLLRFESEWSKHWRGTLPFKHDADITREDIASRHLILFGDPASNSLIGQVLDGLPLQWTKDEIRFKGKSYPADGHVPVMIFPSPLNAQRYVVINSGHTIPSADYQKTNALLFPRLGDYAILGVDGSVIDAGLFDEFWD